MPDEKQNGDRFPLTRFSVITAARSDDRNERERALETLATSYWKPVYKYIRLRWTRPADDAQDLTQGFFLELLERELLIRYDPRKSRLRTYLRLCVDSFVMNEDKAARRLKRGGLATHVALDFAGAEGELDSAAVDVASLASPVSLDAFFEKEWIRSLFTLAVEDLRSLCATRNRSLAFALFEAYDLDDAGHLSYEDLAATHHVAVTDVTNALSWARREFRGIALLRLRETCGSDDEFRREARAIFGQDAQ
jgi:DNA-directed RNA polymerase specialized sigma24 family protein